MSNPPRLQIQSTIIIIIIIYLVALGGSIVKGDQKSKRDHHGGLRPGFYKKSCPAAESIVRSMIRDRIKGKPGMPAKLLRLHYHDCFVRGCDASILLDPSGKGPIEKQARPNLSVSGYEVIDEIKTRIEKECPGIVSCADIVALSARDAISASSNGGKDLWDVPTGRRDGVISKASEAANGNLPSPFSNFTELVKTFKAKKLDVKDLVLLSGAHTIGKSHCGAVVRRLFTSNGTDPSLDTKYADFLKSKCGKKPNPATTLEMDPNDAFKFNNHYYRTVLENKGLFVSDAALLTDKRAFKLVEQMQGDPKRFLKEFRRSMVRMGSMDVLTGNQGQIRKNCRKVNG